jgi:hypothetical protein
MSREVRRVPLDFNWPIGEVWEGYQMPDRLRGNRCTDCVNGTTPAACWLYKLAGRIDMLGEDVGAQQLGRNMHPYLARDMDAATTGFINENDRKVSDPSVVRPGADILDLLAGLTGEPPEYHKSWFRGGMGHKVGHAIISAAGLDPRTWGVCPTCEGCGSVEKYPGQRAEADAWAQTGPPTGEGWQFWETVSEGSPVSPVCATADDLITWLVEHKDYRLSAAQQIVSDGSTVGSFMMIPMEGKPVMLDSARDSDILDAMTQED